MPFHSPCHERSNLNWNLSFFSSSPSPLQTHYKELKNSRTSSPSKEYPPHYRELKNISKFSSFSFSDTALSKNTKDSIVICSPGAPQVRWGEVRWSGCNLNVFLQILRGLTILICKYPPPRPLLSSWKGRPTGHKVSSQVCKYLAGAFFWILKDS